MFTRQAVSAKQHRTKDRSLDHPLMNSRQALVAAAVRGLSLPEVRPLILRHARLLRSAGSPDLGAKVAARAITLPQENTPPSPALPLSATPQSFDRPPVLSMRNIRTRLHEYERLKDLGEEKAALRHIEETFRLARKISSLAHPITAQVLTNYLAQVETVEGPVKPLEPPLPLSQMRFQSSLREP